MPEARVVELGVELDLLDGDREHLGAVLGVGLDVVREDEPADLTEVREGVLELDGAPPDVRVTSERTTWRVATST